MPQDTEEQSPSGFDLNKLLGIASRRHFHFLIPLLFGWLAVWGSSWCITPRYRSGTFILVEQPTMPKDYVVPNIADDLQERLQSITQQILSRTRLSHIIAEFNLYSSKPGQLNQDEIVELMRKDIEIELVRDRNNNRVTAFNVYYTSPDPHIAQQVTSELTNLFINENLEVRQQQSEDTTKFLADQLDMARKNLAEQEQKVREFKSQHMGELPGQLGTNLQILSGLQSQMQTEADSLNAAKQQHAYLQTLVNQYRTVQAAPKSADGVPIGVPALDEELNKLNRQLEDLSSRYTDQHPDIRKLKQQIANTEKMRQQILADLKARQAGAETSNGDTDTVDADAGVGQTASPMAQLEGQLLANQTEITNREHAIADLQNKISEYQSRLNQEPVREQQLADLTRGYDQSKANYDELLKKKNESAMATNMELLQQGERFQILDPPSLPVKPDFPNRLKFSGIGLAAGLVLGVVVAGAFEMLDDRLYDEKELKQLLPTPVISEIPVITNRADQRNKQRRTWLSWATAAGVVVTIVAGSAFTYFRG